MNIFYDHTQISVNEVDLRILRNSFKEMGLEPGSRHGNEILSVEELESLLVSIFHQASKGRENFIQEEKSTELTLSFLLKCLDR